MRMRAHPAAITRRLFLRLVAFAGGALGLSAGASPRPATASADAGTPRLAERAPAPVAQQPIRVALSIHEGTNMAAAVAPDGRTVAIDLLSVLWLVPADGGEARRLTDDFQDVAQPDWAPDGESLVFQSYRDGNYHLWSIARDGTNLKQLTSGPFDHREPQFSPDGRAIAFSSDRSGSYDVWVLDLASGEMTQRTAGPADRSQPAWSPDGREIAFVVEGTALAVIDLAGNERTLARVDAEDRLSAPSWSPDGSGLLYTLGTAGESRLVLAGEPITSGEDVFPFR